MKMRELGKSSVLVSEVGLGCEHLQGKDAKRIDEVISAAMDGGINILDLFMSEPKVRSDIGRALKGRRDKMLVQGHIGSVWLDGQYDRNRDIEKNRFFFEDLLKRLDTDYIDIGMIHFVDGDADLDAVLNGPVINYAREMKERGAIRLIGMSSHNPAVARRAVETGLLDVLMFSINPAYDLLPEGIEIEGLMSEEAYRGKAFGGTHPERARLYEACEKMGVGVTVMKTLGAGTLLDAKRSPFGIALSAHQLMQYALSRPAVSSVLVGCQTAGEVAQALAFETAAEAEKDYSPVLSASRAYPATGRCMYCNHCHPCPAGIDVAAVNRYLDIALTAGEVPETVKKHYLALPQKGGDCIGCAACESRCPFGVRVVSRMEKAKEIFGA